MLLEKTHQKIYFWALAYLCFTVPFMSKSLPFTIGIGAITLNWLAQGRLFFRVKKSISCLWVQLFLAFYLLHAISGLYSINHVESYRDLILKLPFLLLPLFVSAIKISSKQKNKLLDFWVISCSIISFWLIIQAFFSYFETGLIKHFFYQDFAKKYHPAYFSTYCLTALLFLFYRRYNVIWKIIWGVLFVLVVFLLASRAQIVALIVLSSYFFLRAIFFQKIKNKGLLIAVAIIVASFFCSNEIIKKYSRFNLLQKEVISFFNHKSDKSVRAIIWDCSWDKIKNNWVFGYGSGDDFHELNNEIQLRLALSEKLINQKVNDIINNKEKMEYVVKRSEDLGVDKDDFVLTYAKWILTNNTLKPYDKFYKHYYNCHNQFLQSWLSSGFLSVIILLFLFLSLIKKGITEKSDLILSIVFLILTSLLTESMLERQYGVIYFTLVMCFLFTHKNKHV